MSTTTHRIAVNDEAYTNISNGNINCTVIVRVRQKFRAVIGGTEPLADEPQYIPLVGPEQAGPYNSIGSAISIENLEAEDDIWIRAEEGEAEILAVRGPAKVTV